MLDSKCLVEESTTMTGLVGSSELAEHYAPAKQLL